MNGFLPWVRRHKILSAFLLAMLLCWLYYHLPFSRPSDPVFVESLFRLRSYDYLRRFDTKRLQKDLAILFPVGTPKEYVDLMLVERGGAIETNQTNYVVGQYRYLYRALSLALTPDAWFFNVYYDKEKRLKALQFGGEFIIGKSYKPKLVGDSNE